MKSKNQILLESKIRKMVREELLTEFDNNYMSAAEDAVNKVYDIIHDFNKKK